MTYQNLEASKSSCNSNYSKYSVQCKRFNSGAKHKGEYYNYNDNFLKESQMSGLARNGSDNALLEDAKGKNYISIAKMCQKGDVPQTARNHPSAITSMVDNLRAKPQKS